jgi:hypothetical protein
MPDYSLCDSLARFLSGIINTGLFLAQKDFPSSRGLSLSPNNP